MTPESLQLQSVENSDAVRSLTEGDRASVISLIQELVRIPTRGGLDPCEPIIDCVSQWLTEHDLPSRRLHYIDTGRPVALVCDVTGHHPGPRYILDACLDTAPFGDSSTWQHEPTSGATENGWLYGRGSADCKAAIAIFMHIATHLHKARSRLYGSLTLLFDADEHTGNFGGAKRYFGAPDAPRDVLGVMIGYPGTDELIIGGRGFLRAEITARGEAGHTGSQHAVDNGNAVEKAAELVRLICNHRTPGSVDPALGLPPKITVTKIAGGEGYSIIPDSCTIGVDARLTTTFDETSGKKIIEAAVAQVDERLSPTLPTTVTFHESWPAYRLDENAPVRVALTRAAERHLKKRLPAKVAGPSNIGNYLAKLGIDATAGLGVRYKDLHGTNERIELATIPIVQAIYHEAALRLLSPQLRLDAGR
jgi:succinyl-diaminopimelate desuccinylase